MAGCTLSLKHRVESQEDTGEETFSLYIRVVGYAHPDSTFNLASDYPSVIDTISTLLYVMGEYSCGIMVELGLVCYCN